MKAKAHLEKLIPLYLYDELDAAGKKEFEIHIKYCDACKEKLEEMRSLQAILDKKRVYQPSEAILEKSRSRLFARLRQEHPVVLKDPWWVRIEEWMTSRTLTFQLAGATAMLLLGLLIGRFVMAPGATGGPAGSMKLSHVPQEERFEPLVANIDHIQYDPQTGQVTVQYKNVNDVSLKGNIQDAGIQRVLLHAIQNEQNPGYRLMAVKAFADQTFANDEIERALVYAMEHDAIDGVRLRAARVLSKFPMSDFIKQAFIRILLKDVNPAIRIEAVNALSQDTKNTDLAPILREVAKEDSNEFIQFKASKALQRLPESTQEGKE